MTVLSPHSRANTLTISNQECEFFVELGARIAQLRENRSVAQVQLAEALNVSQQTFQAYEVGRRRIPVSALPVVAHTLTVPLEELFGETEPVTSAPRKRGPVPRWQQQIEAIARRPKTQQRFVAQRLDTVLAQQSRQSA